ncbi:MAG: glycogen synthase GlgA [Porticoccus sp.]|nr:glycogen synthase GlgA [Porticoccus sp.]
MNKVLFVSSEAYPLIKTGGLADVAGSLPRALIKLNQDVRLLLPAYPAVLEKITKPKLIDEQIHYGQVVQVLETRLPGSRVTVWLVKCPAAFDRPGTPYSDSDGKEWPDNAFRFALFSQVAANIAMGFSQLPWKPDVVHCNDWQSGLVPALLSVHKKRPATIFTIHNLSYQGVFNKQTFLDLHLPPKLWTLHGLEFHNQVSFIKGGLTYADRITTVSPTYANEIQTPEFGYGLDDLLKHRKDKLSGIINGIDTDVWNPGTDACLEQKYNKRSLDKKINNKTDFQMEMGLPNERHTPLLGMVGRLVEQKGVDIILDALVALLQMPIQIAILGTGEKKFEDRLTQLAEKFPDKLKAIIGYDECLSHKIEAASDIYLMPSKFEPCGLNQLYSLRYGTLPIVRNVGGLADTVINTTKLSIENHTATGFYVADNDPTSLISSVQSAIKLYKDPVAWKQLQQNAMGQDFSWQKSAEKYITLYNEAIKSS